MYTLLADRLERAERQRTFWPRFCHRLAVCCECLVYAILILIGHILVYRWLLTRS